MKPVPQQQGERPDPARPVRRWAELLRLLLTPTVLSSLLQLVRELLR